MAAQPDRSPRIELTPLPPTSPSSGARWSRAAVTKVGIPTIRGLLAVALSVGLMLGSDKAVTMLGNFIGIYILSDGIASLRFWFAVERHSPHASMLPGLAGGLGILTGLVAVGRAALEGAVPRSEILVLVGVLALLTGWTGVIRGFDLAQAVPAGGVDRGKRFRMVQTCLLGGFEMLLGGILVFADSADVNLPLRQLTPVVVGWALVAAATLFTEAWIQRTLILGSQEQIGEA